MTLTNVKSSNVQKPAECTECGETFACGATTGSCWCFTMHQIMPVPSENGSGCLCPRCLAKIVTAKSQGDQTGHNVELFSPVTIACIQQIGPYGPSLTSLWSKLRDWAQPRGVWTASNYAFGISYDDPITTPPAECRYDACVQISSTTVVDGGPSRATLIGGQYLLVPFRGTAIEIGPAFQNAMHISLPRSGRQFDHARPIFERYRCEMKSSDSVFSCELCIPVK